MQRKDLHATVVFYSQRGAVHGTEPVSVGVCVCHSFSTANLCLVCTDSQPPCTARDSLQEHCSASHSNRNANSAKRVFSLRDSVFQLSTGPIGWGSICPVLTVNEGDVMFLSWSYNPRLPMRDLHSSPPPSPGFSFPLLSRSILTTPPFSLSFPTLSPSLPPPLPFFLSLQEMWLKSSLIMSASESKQTTLVQSHYRMTPAILPACPALCLS